MLPRALTGQLQKGDLVYPIVEITNTGRPHQTEWARLPKISSYQDQGEASQVAIRIDWVKEGNWKRQYVHASHVVQISGDIDSPMYLSYAHAIGLKTYLQGYRVQQTNLAHVHDRGVAKIRQMKFDFLAQQYIFEEPAVKGTKLLAAKTNRQAQAQQLRQAGAQRIGISWPCKPVLTAITQARSGGRGGAVRTKCDTCYLFSRTEQNQAGGSNQCTRNGQTNRCMTCQRLGRDCSWTHSSNLVPGSPLWDLIRAQAASTELERDAGNDRKIVIKDL